PAARTPRTAAVLEVALEAAAGQTAVAVDDLFAGAARQFDRGFTHIAPHVAAIRIEAAAIHIGPRAALGVGAARRAARLNLGFRRTHVHDGETARRHDQTCRCNHEFLHDTVSFEISLGAQRALALNVHHAR